MSNRPHPTDSTAPDPAHEREWTVTLPDAIGSRIDQRLPNTEFDSAEAYVSYALEALLEELDEQDTVASNGDPHNGSETAVSDADDDTESIAERLESLGYL